MTRVGPLIVEAARNVDGIPSYATIIRAGMAPIAEFRRKMTGITRPAGRGAQPGRSGTAKRTAVWPFQRRFDGITSMVLSAGVVTGVSPS